MQTDNAEVEHDQHERQYKIYLERREQEEQDEQALIKAQMEEEKRRTKVSNSNRKNKR